MVTPKIMVYDIETNGVNARHADLGFVLSFSWMDMEDKRAKVKTIADFGSFEKDPHDDRELLKFIYKTLQEADGVIAHFGDGFDLPFIETRLAIHGLGSLSDLNTCDTCKIAWKKLKLSSNRLKNLCKVLRCKYKKMDIHAEGLWPTSWHNSMLGIRKDIRKIGVYNKYDVLSLRDVAEKLRPHWPQRFVNRLYPKQSGRICAKCGFTGKFRSLGERVHQRRVKRRLVCTKCSYSGNYEEL